MIDPRAFATGLTELRSPPRGGPWDPPLSSQEGRLYFEGCSLEQLADVYGTPLYVVSEDRLRTNYQRFARAFGACWPEGPVHVLPSIKANFALALRAILTEEGAGCDTFGPGEWYAARQTRVRPELISVNGSSKDAQLIEEAVRAGARITLDSLEEVELVTKAARRSGRRAQVRVRLRPDYEGLDQPSDFGYDGESVRDLARRYKPGIATETLLAHGATFLDAPDLELTGVMVHLGRHRADLPTWKAMVDSVVEVLGKISRAWGGWEPTEIDLGGGFATPRDPTGRLTPRGHARPPGDQAPTIEEYAGVLTSHLRSGLAREHLQARGKTLEVEPGRSLFADAGVHLTRVRHLKSERRPEARRWVETDTTEMFLLDSLVEHARWTPVVVRQPDRPATQTADLVGISCGFDIIVPDAHLPEVEVGDVIAFLDTGAYQEACANNFNALPRPGTVLVRGRESEWIKVPETVGDVFRRDRLPARLGSNPDGGPR